MRSRPLVLLGIALAGCFVLAHADDKKPKDKKDKAEFVNLGDVNAEVAVLNVLHSLQPTAAQLQALRKASAKTMQKAPPRKMVKVSDKLRKTLTALRDALAAGDDEKIDELFQQFDELRLKEDPEFDDIEVTEAAREQAPGLVRQLSARQVAVYVSGVADFPDPIERLVQTMEESRKLRGKEWRTLRDDSAYQVGWLVAGLDAKVEEKVRDRATALLNKAYKLSDKAYAADRASLEKEARDIVGQVGPTEVIRHFMERVIAETLSSYRLAAALDARAKAK